MLEKHIGQLSFPKARWKMTEKKQQHDNKLNMKRSVVKNTKTHKNKNNTRTTVLERSVA